MWTVCELCLVITFCCLPSLRLFAQSVPIPLCPSIQIVAPEGILLPSQTFTARAEVPAPARQGASFRWAVSGGSIVKGQGTPTVLVQTQPGLGGVVKVEVTVGGLPEGCFPTASTQITVAENIDRVHFDTYTEVSREQENMRLDFFAKSVKGTNHARGFIVVYGPHQSMIERGRRARDYLVKVRELPTEKVVVVYGGRKREKEVRLYVIADGAPEPPFR